MRWACCIRIRPPSPSWLLEESCMAPEPLSWASPTRRGMPMCNIKCNSVIVKSLKTLEDPEDMYTTQSLNGILSQVPVLMADVALTFGLCWTLRARIGLFYFSVPENRERWLWCRLMTWLVLVLTVLNFFLKDWGDKCWLQNRWLLGMPPKQLTVCCTCGYVWINFIDSYIYVHFVMTIVGSFYLILYYKCLVFFHSICAKWLAEHLSGDAVVPVHWGPQAVQDVVKRPAPGLVKFEPLCRLTCSRFKSKR